MLSSCEGGESFVPRVRTLPQRFSSVVVTNVGVGSGGTDEPSSPVTPFLLQLSHSGLQMSFQRKSRWW
ncbi:hypothetical protein HSB1_09840 [Halogranum salarium B-1]|uniref:Uncharacterized protein n=1 Tax=Halogranum salarium B-1 TaxID=1210908 RepID=J3JGT7_9EURY|nr:hypothetical protein HSB1_09840 [Halogranum salarium B-1]